MKVKVKAIVVVVWLISIVTGFYAGYRLHPQQLDQLRGETTVYIAPYINNTHPCYRHAASCTAELPNTVVRYVIDSSDKFVHQESEATTGANGFFTVKVPTQKSYQIRMWVDLGSIPFEGYTQFSTYTDSPNCITTGQLHRL
ncbi:MAG: CueP family metal-binding protein [Candidatus Heimdallarchaeota archaeon]